MTLSAEQLNILQLTDTHLFAGKHGMLKGVDTRASLHTVLDDVRRQQWQPDIILASGDLVHDESAAGYATLIDMLRSLERPIYALPGNHDNLDVMQACLNAPATQICGSAHNDYWCLIMLNSATPGADGGRLAAEELARLDHTLEQVPEKFALICLHHHALPVGSRWLDAIGLRNAKALFEVIDKHRHVRALLCGHIHQAFESRHNQIQVLATPSTCVQFMPNNDSFALDRKPPGYRRLELKPDGRIKTDVRRVSNGDSIYISPNGV